METVREAAAKLLQLAVNVAHSRDHIARKRSLRPSEKAMALADCEMKLDALAIAISCMNGGAVSRGMIARSQGWPAKAQWAMLPGYHSEGKGT